MKYGLIKTSLVDYPEHVAGVVFLPGCNLRCPYCHNPELVSAGSVEEGVTIEELSLFLKKRKNVLDGMVITGGEPTIHNDLQILVDIIKNEGLNVKLDTNGLFPEVLKSLKNVDFIAMDIKTSPSRYHLVEPRIKSTSDTGEDISDKLKQSISYILESGLLHQFRTTLVENIVTDSDIIEICSLIQGCSQYRVTPCKEGNTLMKGFSGNTSTQYLDRMVQICRNYNIPVSLE